MAVEQGSERYENSIIIIINPRRILKAKQWLVNEYLNLDIKDMNILEILVNKEEYRKDIKYNEQLIEFLKSTL